MQITTARLELRVMELEDTVRLLTTVAQTLNEMLGNLNEVATLHTQLISGVLERLGDAKDDDLPPWSSHDVGNT